MMVVVVDSQWMFEGKVVALTKTMRMMMMR